MQCGKGRPTPHRWMGWHSLDEKMPFIELTDQQAINPSQRKSRATILLQILHFPKMYSLIFQRHGFEDSCLICRCLKTKSSAASMALIHVPCFYLPPFKAAHNIPWVSARCLPRLDSQHSPHHLTAVLHSLVGSLTLYEIVPYLSWLLF